MNLTSNTTISSVYEVCIGVPDAISAIQYWQQFGYRIGEIGELTATIAYQLYRVNSPLQSIRLYHQNADHGLIRLMIWQNPTSAGLGISSMKRKGNRWGTTLTADILGLLNHAEAAKSIGENILYTQTNWEVIYNKDQQVLDLGRNHRESR